MRLLAPAVIVPALAGVVACGPPARVSPSERYRGMLLNARELGASELARVTAEDPAVRDWVARDGQPDFILIGSAQDVELIYYQASRVVLFHRPDPDAPARVGVAEPLPSSVRPLLPADLRAGTGEPPEDPGTSCWTIDVEAERCRTCCQSPIACVVDCTARAE